MQRRGLDQQRASQPHHQVAWPADAEHADRWHRHHDRYVDQGGARSTDNVNGAWAIAATESKHEGVLVASTSMPEQVRPVPCGGGKLGQVRGVGVLLPAFVRQRVDQARLRGRRRDRMVTAGAAEGSPSGAVIAGGLAKHHDR
jgi:hypothetical protein